MQPIEDLLTIKINPPRIGIETIWRKRLLESFDGYEHKKLTIVSAPTGYGKTVLISQFATQRNNPVAWYQLDEFDNDLTLFIRYFIAGISKKIPHYGLQTLAFIEKNEDISKQIRSIVVLLANELEARAKEGLTFILDDYHLINEILIHKFVEELIQYLPEGVHLVISSRYVLPLNVVRLKAHGLVNEITYDHLKFSRDEIRMFFNSQKESVISEEIIDKYQLETGGWAVALSLIKASVLRMEDSKKDLSLFQWKNREEVYTYFAEEVLSQLPIEFQTFLINTSILDVITPDICNELTERENSNEILENLINQNVFLIKFEGEEEYYRYHHLFRDFLQHHLGNKKKMLLEKAGKYFMKNGHYEQAIESYIHAGVFEKAASIIEKIGIRMIKAGNWQTVNRWIEKIPKKVVEKSPYFILFRGVIYSNKGMWNEAFIQIDNALKIFLSCENKEDILHARFQKAIVLRRAGLLHESLKVLNEILSSVNTLPIIEWYDIVLEKVNTLLWSGALNEAVETLRQGIKFAQHDEEHRLIAYFMEHLGATYYATGDYYKAIKYYKASNEKYLQEYNSLSEVEKERYSQRTTLARIYRDWGELDKALELIREEIDIKERLGLMDDLPRAYHQLALICNDRGDKEAAERYFQHADEMYGKLDRRDFQWTWHLALYGKILIDNGKREKGKKLIEKAIECAKENSSFNLAVCEFVGCYAYIDSGRIGEAINLLEHALEVGKNVGAKNLICQCFWVLSNIYLKMGNEEKASEYALQSFTLARQGNYLQIFLSYEQTSFPIIKLGIEMGIEEDFIKKIVLRLGTKSEAMLLELIESNQADIKHRAKELLLKVKGPENPLIYVYCFGNFEVFGKDDTNPVEWKTSKAKELFAYLMRNANKTISKEKILEDIWPDMDPEQTSKWLHTYIYQIRRVMKGYGITKGLIYKNKGYCLDGKSISSDVDGFENLINNSIEEIDNSVEYLKKAIVLYKGEYLEGLYNKWIIEEKNRLEWIYLVALERLAIIYMEAKEYNNAVNYLDIILKTDPLTEKAHEMLMIIYQKIGDRIAAINQYEAYCKALKDELEIEPKKEMKDLYNKLLMTDG